MGAREKLNDVWFTVSAVAAVLVGLATGSMGACFATFAVAVAVAIYMGSIRPDRY
jgi:hypothetical protein